ncbi:hypothetical protein D3C85_1447460 [compost metagenome]
MFTKKADVLFMTRSFSTQSLKAALRLGDGRCNSFDRSSGVMIERVKYSIVQQACALNLGIIDVGPDFRFLQLERPDG